METKVIKIDGEPTAELLEPAVQILCNGGLAAIPTETVYGLGANGLDAAAVKRIYEAKGRPSDNPLILHIADKQDILRLTSDFNAAAEKLMDIFCPGPLTLVVKRSAIVPDAATGGLDTVGVRMPDNAATRMLIRQAGVPVAAPSANTSGRPSPTTAQMVLDDLNGRIDVVIDDGHCSLGLESTIVDCTEPVVTILRPGAVTKEMLEAVVGEVKIDPAIAGASSRPKAPGMKYTHYAPLVPLYLLEGQAADMQAGMEREISKAQHEGKRVGVIASNEVTASLPDNIIKISYGQQGELRKIGASLYECLRYFDDKPVDIILGEGTSEQGFGMAVMNRLHKAAGFRIINI